MDILLIEDDEGIRTVLIECLTDKGYVVYGAEHGADALALLGSTMATPRLMLLDLMMPIMDGWAFRRRQRANPAWADIPVVVLTALGVVVQPHGHDASEQLCDRKSDQY
jgi:CheY-like chemotaxis protein